MPSVSPKSSQWSFTIPTFNDKTIDRLSSLPSSDLVVYVTFAVCDDDTGRYIQALVKTSRSCRTGMLRKLTGNAIFSRVARPSGILMDIHMKPSFKEFGVSPFERHTREIASLKDAVDHGVYSIDYLMDTYPYICTRHTGLVLKYIHDVITNPVTPEFQPQGILCA